MQAGVEWPLTEILIYISIMTNEVESFKKCLFHCREQKILYNQVSVLTFRDYIRIDKLLVKSTLFLYSPSQLFLCAISYYYFIHFCYLFNHF